MTSEIIQSDIDLTRHMLDQRRADSEIIGVLGKRGIDTDRAALLIDDLRYGRKVVPHLPLGYHITPRGPAARGARASGSASARAEAGRRANPNPVGAATALLEEADLEGLPLISSPIQPNPDLKRRAGRKSGRIPALKWVVVALGLAALAVVAWVLWSRAV